MPSRSGTAVVLALACAALGATRGAAPAAAQRPTLVGARVMPGAPDTLAAPGVADTPRVGGPPVGRSPADELRTFPAPRWAPVASLVVPGAGQAALRQTRGVAYVVAEAYAWVQALEYRREANRHRADYRRRAREVARAPFGAVQRDTSWAYFEALYDWVASGAYNRTPSGPLTPETDTLTYNGRQWYEARALFYDPFTVLPPSDPRYQRALAAYATRAVKDDFLWSWRDRQLDWDIYKGDVTRENQLSRDWTMTLIVIGANHLVSAIDALASVRLRESRGPLGERRIEATVPWPPFGRRPGRRP